MEKDKIFTNEIAEKFWELCGIGRIASIIIFIIVIGISIWLKSLTFLFIGLFIITIVLLWTMVFLGISEVIERLQNIENSITK